MRLFYGWVVVAVAFVTMAIARDARLPGRRGLGVPLVYRPVVLFAELVRAPPRPGDERRVLGRGRRLDRALPGAPGADRRCRLAHRVHGVRHRRTAGPRAAQPA